MWLQGLKFLGRTFFRSVIGLTLCNVQFLTASASEPCSASKTMLRVFVDGRKDLAALCELFCDLQIFFCGRLVDRKRLKAFGSRGPQVWFGRTPRENRPNMTPDSLVVSESWVLVL